MTRTLIPGAWYGDHLPTGEYCALIPNQHVLTHLGPVPFPPGEHFGPLFPRCTTVNGFRFAGQAHDTTDPATWEWTETIGWHGYGPPCCGVSPVIYDRDGMLHISDCSVGSQGYRYVAPENVIVSGDATYSIDLPDGQRLFEYTSIDEVFPVLIGQAAYDGGGVQVWDGTVLRQLELGDCRFIRANREGDLVALAFTRPEGVVLMTLTMADLRALSPVVPPEPPDPPPVPEPIGPRSQPLPDGTVVDDLLPYVRGESACWPRSGPDHTLGQKRRGDFWDYVKFAGNEPALAQGQSYETWWANPYWIGQLEDASAYDPYQQTDQRMWPRRMQVGEAHAFVTPPHEIVWRKRPTAPVASALLPILGGRADARAFSWVSDTALTDIQPCMETKRQPWGRRMWLHALWPQFYCGPDLGVRAVAMLVYDDTAGIHEPGRYFEIGFYAFGAGSIQWEAHKAWELYPPGATTAQFSEATLAERKSFYLIGGPDPSAMLLGCVPQQIPNYGPWEPEPKPPAEPYYRAKVYEVK